MDEQSRAEIVARIPELRGLDPGRLDRVLRVLRPLEAGGLALSGMERLNTLLEVPHPERFVPSLPTADLFFFLQDVGLRDCADLVRYASSEQLGGFIDLGCWEKDRFSVERFQEWFDVVRESTSSQVDRLLEAVDPELLVLVLQRSARVYDVREAPEDIPEDELMFPSPDGAYRIVMGADDDKYPLVNNLLVRLYDRDLEAGRRLLQACRWELPTPLEESCYQWRVGRAGDMGFLPFDEAVEIEKDIDIRALEQGLREGDDPLDVIGAPDAPHPFTGWFLSLPGQGMVLAEVLAGMEDRQARERLLAGLLQMLQRRLSVRGLDLGDWSLVGEEMEHVYRMVSLGLERLLPAAGGTAAVLLTRLPLVALYRTGVTTLRTLTRRAVAVARRGGVLPGQNPFDAPSDLWLEGLRTQPPRRLMTVAQRPKRGERAHELFEPFATLSQVAEALAILDEAEAVVSLFEERWGWGEERFEAPDLAGLDEGQRTELRFSTLLLTGLTNQLLGRSADFQPLGAAHLAELRALIFVPGEGRAVLDPVVRRQIEAQVVGLAPQGDEAARALRRFVGRALDRLEDSLGHLPPDEPPDPRFVDCVLVA